VLSPDNLVFGINLPVYEYDVIIGEEILQHKQKIYLMDIVLPITLRLEVQISFAGSINTLYNTNNTSIINDLYILMYGFFYNPSIFVQEKGDYIYDCHTGNILYNILRNGDMIFIWSDFGRSLSKEYYFC
jgi:hypothetical protein